MTVVLALSLLWLAYIYLGYPIVLSLLARLSPSGGAARNEEETPTVTVLISAYNEVDSIVDTVENKLACHYPESKLDVIVVSDGSEDGTDEAVRALESRHEGRVHLVVQSPRQGKTAALNLAAPEAKGEIIVFSDANSIYEADAIRNLVSNFSDPAVGYVTGKMVYTNPDGSITGDGCTTYMRYENILRDWETRVGSVVGVDGGIDAIRKRLYRAMEPHQLPDFVLPLQVLEQGFRVAYEPEAVLHEQALGSTSREYRMRVRVTLRALWALWDHRRLFNPFRFPRFAWQLASHKLLRYLAFLPQLAALTSNFVLSPIALPYRALLVVQLLFYCLALIGYLLRDSRHRFFLATGPFYLTLLNVACAHAVLRLLRGEKQVTWTPRVG